MMDNSALGTIQYLALVALLGLQNCMVNSTYKKIERIEARCSGPSSAK